MTGNPRIVVFGAGSIGCYVGGRLLAAGAAVTFVGRPRLRDELATHGLHLSDHRGFDRRLEPARIDFASALPALDATGCVLVTTKSAATAEAAGALHPRLRPGTPVISFQNGLRNAEVLRTALPQARVLTGMVPFNVVARGEGRFHQGSAGELAVQRDPALAPLGEVFRLAGLPLVTHDDMPAVQWAKLLLNLNNAINALSGLPLKEELAQRGYRRCLALAQREALALLRAAGIRPARLTPLPPALLARLLTVPDFLFRRLAAKMLEIDPLARSSMWEDFVAGRGTEIEHINGEVVALASRLRRTAPVNAKLVALVHAAEAGGRRDWPAAPLLSALRAG